MAPRTDKTIGLAMIVKDAEESLPVMLASLNGIADPERSTIIDTGSTDATMEIFQDWGAKPIKRKWRNFQHNRSQLMKTAKGKADYNLLLDADMELQWRHDNLVLDADCVMARLMFRSLDYALPFFTKGDRDWFYRGYAHSYLEGDGQPVSHVETDAFTVMDHSHTTQEKIRRDLDLLWQELKDTAFDNPRAWYYLAQTYRDLDRVMEAIALYYMRSRMGGGYEEERWHALYQAGTLAVEHQSFTVGADLLLEAFKQRQHRAEPLRALANSANSVADKIPYPTQDRLFVHRPHYKQEMPLAQPRVSVTVEIDTEMPPMPSVASSPKNRRKHFRGASLSPKSVSAIIVTRGDKDLAPTVAPLPYDDIIVWNNMQEALYRNEEIAGKNIRMYGGTDYRIFGRYAAIPRAHNPVIFWVDDDVVFTAHDALLSEYEPGLLISNMDSAWLQGAGYQREDGSIPMAMVGAGSLCDADWPERIWNKYLSHFAFDAEVLLECDFAFGTLMPHKVVDVGYGVREFADDPDRLYQQPGQTARKWDMIARAESILDK